MLVILSSCHPVILPSCHLAVRSPSCSPAMVFTVVGMCLRIFPESWKSQLHSISK
ncbi:hypothetical protein L211DRAFT_614022 [Terfezia boudieri ATCC MYA-4762]|uniref:Uncharacterized protein n=1 Tax=Terfezia boudieri ATCC MYA-4762 TaxID=1051890 RepID=A0A3N4LWK7_9PEZI|nr:hypothetical protein L211DRAFT_614022 [Terfezia boudieri ATCC MYA-4762]